MTNNLNYVKRGGEHAPPVRRTIIVCATRVEFERYRAQQRLSREQAVPVCDLPDAQRAARLYGSYSHRELVLLSRPMRDAPAILETLHRAGISPYAARHRSAEAGRP